MGDKVPFGNHANQKTMKVRSCKKGVERKGTNCKHFCGINVLGYFFCKRGGKFWSMKPEYLCCEKHKFCYEK